MKNIIFASNRNEWRSWLNENFETQQEVWLKLPYKASGIASVSINDSVEEALCFGWIDSVKYKFDDNFTIQRFSKRNPKSKYSQLNKERLKWLFDRQMISESILELVKPILEEEFIFPEDIIKEINMDGQTKANFENFPETYKRIRIAHIHSARDTPDEFTKRLGKFLTFTKENRKISTSGGAEKYGKL